MSDTQKMYSTDQVVAFANWMLRQPKTEYDQANDKPARVWDNHLPNWEAESGEVPLRPGQCIAINLVGGYVIYSEIHSIEKNPEKSQE